MRAWGEVYLLLQTVYVNFRERSYSYLNSKVALKGKAVKCCCTALSVLHSPTWSTLALTADGNKESDIVYTYTASNERKENGFFFFYYYFKAAKRRVDFVIESDHCLPDIICLRAGLIPWSQKWRQEVCDKTQDEQKSFAELFLFPCGLCFHHYRLPQTIISIAHFKALWEIVALKIFLIHYSDTKWGAVGL